MIELDLRENPLADLDLVKEALNVQILHLPKCKHLLPENIRQALISSSIIHLDMTKCELKDLIVASNLEVLKFAENKVETLPLNIG